MNTIKNLLNKLKNVKDKLQGRTVNNKIIQTVLVIILFLFVLFANIIACLYLPFNYFLIILLIELMALLTVGLVVLCKYYRGKKYTLRKQYINDLKVVINRCRQKEINIKSKPWILLIGEENSGKKSLIEHIDVKEVKFCGQKNSIQCYYSHQALLINVKLPAYNNADIEKFINSFSILLKVIASVNKKNSISSMVLAIPTDKLLKMSYVEKTELSKISSELYYEITRILEKKPPIYTLITKCDQMVGYNNFFNLIGNDRSDEILGFTNIQKVDTTVDFNTFAKQLDKVNENIYSLRTELLYKIRKENFKENQLDDVDNLYIFPYNLKNLSEKIQSFFKFVFAFSEANDFSMPVRGVYYTSCFDSYDKINALYDKTFDNSREVGNIENNNTQRASESLFISEVFNKVIFSEKNLALPSIDNFFSLRLKYRTIFNFGIIIFLAIILLTVNSGWILDKELKYQYKKWTKPVEISNRSYETGILSILPDVPNKRKGADYVDSRLRGVGTRIDYYNYLCLMLKTKDSVNVPILFRIFNILPTKNINKLQSEAINNFYARSFIIPIISFSMKLYFKQLIKWDKTTEEYLYTMLNIVKLNNSSFNLKNHELISIKNKLINIINYIKEAPSINIPVNKKIINMFNENIQKNDHEFNKLLESKNFHKLLEENIRRVCGFDSNINLRNMLLNRFYEIIMFPFNDYEIGKSALNLDEYKNATLIFDGLDSNSKKASSTQEEFVIKRTDNLKDICMRIEELNYIPKKTDIYMTRGNTSKNTVNAYDVFVGAKLITDEQKDETVLHRIRSTNNPNLGSINNVEAENSKICFYKSNENARNNNSDCIFELPSRWTFLQFLFDGYRARPASCKKEYWMTWDAAKRIDNNLWACLIRFIPRQGKELICNLEFSIPDELADSILKLKNNKKKGEDSNE
jgi:hypothetical protein